MSKLSSIKKREEGGKRGDERGLDRCIDHIHQSIHRSDSDLNSNSGQLIKVGRTVCNCRARVGILSLLYCTVGTVCRLRYVCRFRFKI